MNITFFSTHVQNNTISISSIDLFASTHHLESIPSFFLGLTTLTSEYEKLDEVMLNCGEGKISVAIEPSFFADTSSYRYILLWVTQLGKTLMLIGLRLEDVRWCQIPMNNVRFPISFLSYRMKNQRDGSQSDGVVNRLGWNQGGGRRKCRTYGMKRHYVGESAAAHMRQPLGSVTEHGAVIGIPAIEQTNLDHRQKGTNIPNRF